MPKRRMTAKRLAAQEIWQRAGSVAARKRFSYSAARVSPTGGPIASGSYRSAGRTSKIRGKAAYHHSGGAGNVTLAPAAHALLSGGSTSHGLKEFHPSTIRGDVVQTQGTPFRKRRKAAHATGKPKSDSGKHVPSFKGIQLTKKVKGKVSK